MNSQSLGTSSPTRSRNSVVGYLAFLSMLLAFGIDVALPAFGDIRESFDMAPGDTKVSLIITVYFIGLAFGQLFFGMLSDSIGRQRALMLGIGLYAIAAIAASLAPTFGLLLASRFIWGIGAAGPGVMRMAISRDLYSGDEMTRVVTIVMAVFLIGPIFVPFIGTGILAVAPWQFVFVASLLVAGTAFVWSIQFGETLPPERRRPLSFKPLAAGAKAVVTTRATIGRIIAQTFFSGAFFVMLGSSEPIISDIYGRKSQFATWFATIGIVTILFLLINNRLIKKVGSARLLIYLTVAEVVISGVGLFLFALKDGMPSFGLWFVWIALASAILTLANPLCNGLALEPMGELAGTASALLGFATMAFGAILGSLIDRQIQGTVTPMAAGYFGYSAIALAFVLWAANSPVDEVAA